MSKVIIVGGGIAGCTTAIRLAEIGHEIVIVEKSSDILMGTSSRTPGRMGLGFHYFDFDTAKTYLEHTIGFMKEYSDCFLGNEQEPYLQYGRYFIVNDSIVPLLTIMANYDKLGTLFEEICKEDPTNNVFSTTHLHRTMVSSEFENDVAMSKIHYAIETKEKLLDWEKFELRLREKISQHQNINIKTNFDVKVVAVDENSNFLLTDNSKEESANYVINCTWQNIESLNKKLGIGEAHFKKEDPDNSITSRLKLLAEVSLPSEMHDKHSMFFCAGQHAMFSNIGNGIGRITYAPVTNFGVTSESEMPELWKKWLDNGLSEEEKQYYGNKIISGVSDYIPAIKNAKIRDVMAGIVKNKGSVELSDPNITFHKRNYSGVEEQQIGWVDNATMKLSYCLGNAEEVSNIITKQEEALRNLKNVSHDLSGGNFVKDSFFQFYLKRNFSAGVFLEEKSEILKEQLYSQEQQKSVLLHELKETLNNKKIHRVICILDSVNNGELTFSNLDVSPEYLHIHALESNKLQSIADFKKNLSNESVNNHLTQWGVIEEKNANTRYAKVTSNEINRFGQIGIGSASKGDERKNSFVGGGEGFLFGSKNFRITKGGKAFLSTKDEQFWTFQVSDFNGSKSFLEYAGQKINDREELLATLKEKSNGKPFVATFDAIFDEENLARSNGIFSQDNVEENLESVFDITQKEISGGHVIGNSANEGDVKSFNENNKEGRKNDLGLTILSEVLLKPIEEILISRNDGSFRKPRTEVQVRGAVEKIQNLLSKNNNDRDR